MGRLLASLGALGLAPADIHTVLYSHLHVDHVGWTVGGAAAGDAALTFANARHVMSSQEWQHWSRQPDVAGPTSADIAALRDRVDLIDGEQMVLPGVTMVPTFGHTPGHCSFLVSSADERAVVLGDAIHCPLQIGHPEWEFSADANPAAAVRAREHLLREMDQPRTVVVGPHFPDAIFGRVLPGTAPRRVLFDLVPTPEPQRVAAEAPVGEIVLPPLA